MTYTSQEEHDHFEGAAEQSVPQKPMTYTEKILEEFAYQVKRTKECQIVLDHNPVWCGDCFACSECGKIFITAGVANESIAQALAEERVRVVGEIERRAKDPLEAQSFEEGKRISIENLALDSLRSFILDKLTDK